MIEGSASFDCRIFGRSRPVRIVRKRGAVAHQSAPRTGRQIVLDIGLETVRGHSQSRLPISSYAEQAGLKSRIDDALARAAVTLGNDSDEHLTRSPEDNHNQNLLGTEIADGQRRLNELGVTIGHIQFLKTALVTRFPDFKLGTQHFPRER